MTSLDWLKPRASDFRESFLLRGSQASGFDNYRAGAFMRVGTIHAGAADLISPTSIQPDNRVMTIGASSERLDEGREVPTVRCVEAVVEFVMAFSFRSRIVLFGAAISS
jgi:hypothetical protein